MFGRTELSVKALVQRAKNFRTKIFRGGPNFSEKIGPGDQNFQDQNSSDSTFQVIATLSKALI